MTTRYLAAIEITYDLDGEVLEEYLEQLHGNEDTFEARREFLLDRFVPPNWKELLDPSASLVFRELD
jgi:hypothetical protein